MPTQRYVCFTSESGPADRHFQMTAPSHTRKFGQSEGKPESGHLALGHNVSVAPYLDAATPTRHLFMGFRRAYLLSRDRS